MNVIYWLTGIAVVRFLPTSCGEGLGQWVNRIGFLEIGKQLADIWQVCSVLLYVGEIFHAYMTHWDMLSWKVQRRELEHWNGCDVSITYQM